MNGVSQEGGSQNRAGARRRHHQGQWSKEKAGSGKRNLGDISGLAGLGLTESISDTNYDKEERKLFEVSADITRLIADLEKKSDDKSGKKEEEEQTKTQQET